MEVPGAVRNHARHWVAFGLYTAAYTYVMVASDEARPAWLVFATLCGIWSVIAISLYNRRTKRELAAS